MSTPSRIQLDSTWTLFWGLPGYKKPSKLIENPSKHARQDSLAEHFNSRHKVFRGRRGTVQPLDLRLPQESQAKIRDNQRAAI